MKKLLNTLYVSTQGIYLHQEGETLVAEKDRQVLMRLPIHTLSGIVCFGNVMCSPHLLGLCADRGVHVSFLTEHGQFLARVQGGVSGNVLLRMAQMKANMDTAKACELAKNFVIAKILNTRGVLQRRLRDHGPHEGCENAIQQMAVIVRRVQNAGDVDEIRGFEGEAANLYFSVFNSLITSEETAFQIRDRNRRPPLDPTNALLSFVYTLLAHDCEGALESVGLDPQVGFLHALRSGKPALALDLMEEFRAAIADRLVLSLINLNQLTPRDFETSESGAVKMKDDARKLILTSYQKRKQTIVVHPFINEKCEVGLLPYVQALLLARYLRGDLDDYPPFLLK